jgi:AcrR family transcriptional regulator
MMRKNGPPLTREIILQAALQILDEQGLDGLSMRRLALALGVEAMSLYNHVKDKRDLLDGLVDLVLSPMQSPDESQPWDQRLEHIAIELYQVLIRHPYLVLVLSTEQGFPKDPRIIRGMDSMVAALAEAGLRPTQRVSAYRGLFAICLGFVFAHTQGLSKTREQAQAEWDEAEGFHWDPAALPHLTSLEPYFKQTYAEDDFRFMLRAYLSYLRSTAAGREDASPEGERSQNTREG